jgi:hypothetical protein
MIFNELVGAKTGGQLEPTSLGSSPNIHYLYFSILVILLFFLIGKLTHVCVGFS